MILRKIIVAVATALIMSGPGWAQNLFTLVPSPVTDMGNSVACWGDYDNDGDLDVVIAGESADNGTLAKLFRNDSGTFSDAGATLPGVHFASLDWGDYDGDGDLDLLLTGQDSLGIPITRILKNKDGNFLSTSILLPGVYSGQAAWGDFDNDNDPDILLTGIGTDGFYTSQILRNDGAGTFTDIGATLMGTQTGSVCWVDYNHDGLPDACISGDSGGGIYTKLYRNENGTFVEVPFEFAGLAGQATWADLDNDGDADLLECGMDLYIDGHIFIYRNDGNDQFTLIDAVTNNLIMASCDVGDYDNDGKPEFIVTGVVPGCGGSAITLLYHNEGNMEFTEVSTLLPGFKNGSVMWGDYNNDGWSDLLLTGYDSYNAYKTDIYRNLGGNSGFAANTPPSLPVGLASAVDGNSVTLSWNRATDGQTPPTGLFYNVFIGTGATTPDIISPLADLFSGYPRILSTGNACQDTFITVQDLAPGTYYWSVQAFDNGYMGSVFPPAETFTVNATGIGKNENNSISISPNPAADKIMIYLPGNERPVVTIVNSFGQVVAVTTSGSYDVSGLPAGLYMVTAKGFQGKFIKQ